MCKGKLIVTFKGGIVENSNNKGDILITGFLDPVKDLFMVPIDNDAEQQRVTSGFTGAASQRVETEYKDIVQPLHLTHQRNTLLPMRTPHVCQH